MNTRREKINEYIQQKSKVTLSELKKLVPGVSEMTIRRDLETLEREGSIIRVHGGAKSLKSISGLVEDVFSKRSAINTEQKRIIGEKAAKLISQGSSIYLDAGSTIVELVKRIEDAPLLIITNGLNIALDLLHLKQANINVLGGEVNHNNISLAGPQAQSAIERLNIDTAFLAVTAFSIESGFTCGNVHDCALKNAVLKKAKRRIMLMDSTKIGTAMPYTFASIDEIDVIVTDGNMPEETRKYLAEKGIEIL